MFNNKKRNTKKEPNIKNKTLQSRKTREKKKRDVDTGITRQKFLNAGDMYNIFNKTIIKN